ncbi:peptidoglycan-binding protein [Chitinophaga sp. CB10]|uniref:C40 family peptidase n=1 Tax=Chitinophaga sp. CB10 TaxID=1891659 RepID=UPI0025B7E964|nr:peptidoglycan-binding protein [Chitinophaga sp. CB10]
MSRSKIIAVAAAEKGNTETPPGSNRTKYGKWYGLDGYAWCAIFVSYVYDKAGHPLEPIDSPKGFQGCQSGYNYWKKNNRLVTSPQEGDIVLYDWTGKGVCNHTGIFVKWLNAERTSFQAWEGNTATGNDSDGGNVMLRTRNKSSVRAFVKPFALDKEPDIPAPVYLLKKGDRGSDVITLQKLLFDLKYQITVDGIFGEETKGIIEKFQQKNKLAVTGKVDTQLLGLLQEAATKPPVSETKITTGSYIRKGDSGEVVLLIQQALNKKGASPAIAASGVFEATTLAAVKQFQQKNGLDADGVVGPQTFKALGLTNV